MRIWARWEMADIGMRTLHRLGRWGGRAVWAGTCMRGWSVFARRIIVGLIRRMFKVVFLIWGCILKINTITQVQSIIKVGKNISGRAVLALILLPMWVLTPSQNMAKYILTKLNKNMDLPQSQSQPQPQLQQQLQLQLQPTNCPILILISVPITR